MAHQISIRANGFAEMAYSGELPWHGLGQKLEAQAPIETWVTAAGMDWDVQRAKVRYPVSAEAAVNQEYSVDEAHHVLFRSDDKKFLSLVGAGFKVVQPREALEFFRDLVSDAGFQLCTAGTLKGGVKYWAQATKGDRDNIVGNDVVENKLLLATACDGSMQTIVKEVTERVVCANTLSVALGEGGKLVKVSHRSRFDAGAVKAQLGVAVTHFQAFISQARKLAKEKVGPSDVDRFILTLLNSEMSLEPQDEAAVNRLEAARKSVGYTKIAALFNGEGKGSDMSGAKGTAWGLVNAVTEYVDHHRGNTATTKDARLDYAWFGDGDKLKSTAFNQAVALSD